MDPHSHEQQPAFDVSSSRPEHDELQAGGRADEFVGETNETRAVEQGAPSRLPAQTASDAAAATARPQQLPADQAAGAQATASPAGWMPQIADDTDLIEKEWVDKAKEIVAQTAHDPYLQNKEINKVRADYLKKRYNKDLKQSE